MTLAAKTVFITGATRGIGRAIALRAARDGANVVVVGKTGVPHPKLRGTVHETVREVEELGGRAIACVADVRFEDQMAAAVGAAVEAFGGIDVLVNNASAINLTVTPATDMKRFDLMHQVNVRGTFLCTKLCLPWLERAQNPHVVVLSPPPVLKPEYFAPHVAYSLSKFGMSLLVLGFAAEFANAGVAVNALWPRTVIATAAVEHLLGGPEVVARSRSPEIVADAFHALVSRPSRECTGQHFIDEDLLRQAGVTNFEPYAVTPGGDLMPDLFV
jgi:citronellol/citronellal dehydrogenase